MPHPRRDRPTHSGDGRAHPTRGAKPRLPASYRGTSPFERLIRRL